MAPLLFFVNFYLVASTCLLSNVVRAELRSVTTNCTTPGSTPCGPAPSCCSAGLECNYRRGIPICQDENEPFIEGYDRDPCLDPYLFRCDEIVEIPGFCCPIGTSCFTNGNDNIVRCINALGTTAGAIPSGTTGVMPSATPITVADPSIIYSPPTPGTWNTVDSPANCTISSSVRVSQAINASISFNYTGTSIIVHTATSSIGGSFSLIVDGFNTTSTINTLSGPGDDALPACYPNQYPPFTVTPPGYETRQSHTMTLVYTGASPDYMGHTVPNIQFAGFSVPDPALTLLGQGASAGVRQKLELWVLMLTMLFTIFRAL